MMENDGQLHSIINHSIVNSFGACLEKLKKKQKKNEYTIVVRLRRWGRNDGSIASMIHHSKVNRFREYTIVIRFHRLDHSP